MHAMMGYGAAADALDLLWRYHLLDLVLPCVAQHLLEVGAPRDRRRSRKAPPFALTLLRAMDERLGPDSRAPATVWVSVLMAALVAERCRRLRLGDASVVARAEGAEARPLRVYAALVEAVRWEMGAAGPGLPFASTVRMAVDTAAQFLVDECRGRLRDEDVVRDRRRAGEKNEWSHSRTLEFVIKILRAPDLGWAEATSLPGSLFDGSKEAAAQPAQLDD